jgi:hypothetical protein
MMTGDANDYSVCTTWRVEKTEVHLLDVFRLIFNSGGHFSLCKSLISFVWVENFAKM